MEHRSEFEEWISLYAVGSLFGEDLKTFEDHLKVGCDLCEDILKETEAVLSMLPYSLQDVPFSDSILDKTLQKIDASESISNGSSADGFDEIFDEHVSTVYELALKFVKNDADAEKIVEKVFTEIRKKGSIFFKESVDKKFIYRATVKQADSILRKQKENSKKLSVKKYLPKFESDGHHKKRPIYDWSDNMDEVGLYRNIELAIDNLTFVKRAIIILSDVEGMSSYDIGDILEIKPSLAKAKLHQARLFLRGSLSEAYTSSAI